MRVAPRVPQQSKVGRALEVIPTALEVRPLADVDNRIV